MQCVLCKVLLWFGARCCTRTKAMPGSASVGIPSKKASKAARPPAEAPMPTMGNEEVRLLTVFPVLTSVFQKFLRKLAPMNKIQRIRPGINVF